MSFSRNWRAAMYYADQLGWAVFPLRLRSKAPLTAHGFKEATSDLVQLESWARRWPTANIGIALGQASGGLFALDFDPRNGGDRWTFVEEFGPLPETVEAITGSGGYHVLLRGDVRCSVLAPGIDVKGEGGYIVAAPSIHPDGPEYRWEASSRPDDVSVAAAPEWLVARCRARTSRVYASHANDVDPESFVLGAAFRASGWLGPQLRPGVFAVLCPNRDQHTSGHDFDTSTVIFAPQPGRHRGRFHCSHSHCAHLR